MNLNEVLAVLGRQGLQVTGTGSCLYASAGGDGRVLSFTHPEFLVVRGAEGVPSTGLYVLLDRDTPRDTDQLTQRMGDEDTTVRVCHHEEVNVHGIQGELLAVEWNSASERFSSRMLGVLMLRTENEQASPIFRAAGWVPDLFVGVCDGCSFGGNEHCVNRLTTWGMPTRITQTIQVPRWWITDHFAHATMPNPMCVGDVVQSVHPDFPFSFRKVALLSGAWGHYGHGPLPGATLFEVVNR
jgi:hypothetical protein